MWDHNGETTEIGGFMEPGDKVRLVAVTKKGKERIKQHGEWGTITEVREWVQFSSNRGPWLHIDGVGGRWVHRWDDKDFMVQVM